MNCASIERLNGKRRAFTLTEILVAIAIASIFLSGVYLSYIQVARANQDASAKMSAMRNGRAALQSLTDELKTLSDIGGTGFLIAPDIPPYPWGDGFDNDGDGLVDEEDFNGIDDDMTGTDADGAVLSHAVFDPINRLGERPLFLDRPDFGDPDIDEDVRFGRDFIVFQQIPEVPGDILFKVVTYAIPPEGYDGRTDVLVRQTRIERIDPNNPNGPTIVEGGIAPVAFDVLGFDLMFWDGNRPPDEREWLNSWDSTRMSGERFRLPASVYIRLTLRSDPRPKEATPPGTPVETIVLDTMVNIESVIGSPLYERPELPL